MSRKILILTVISFCVVSAQQTWKHNATGGYMVGKVIPIISIII